MAARLGALAHRAVWRGCSLGGQRRTQRVNEKSVDQQVASDRADQLRDGGKRVGPLHGYMGNADSTFLMFGFEYVSMKRPDPNGT